MEDLNWRKSSYTGANGGDCVEVAPLSDEIVVRDSKDPDGPRLQFSRSEFAALTTVIKRASE